MTLVLDSTSKKKLLLLKEIALEMGVKVTEMPKKVTEKEAISDLSKKVNKSMTKKLFAKFDIDYDSYNR